MVTRLNILSYLKSETVSFKEKEHIVKKYNDMLTKVLERMSSIELVEYFFNAKIPRSVKIMITKIIDERKLSNEDLEKIEILLYEQGSFKESDLFKNSYPKVVKKYIINKLYKNNVIDVLCSDKKSLEIKKIVIDISLDKEMLTKALLLVDDVLKEYILSTKLTSLESIIELLKDGNNTLVELVITRYINEVNILSVLNNPLSEDVKLKIIELKSSELNKRLNRLSQNEVMELITNNIKYPECVYNTILNQYKEVILNAANKLSYRKFSKLLCKTKDKQIVKLLIENNSLKVRLSLLLTKDISVLSWLYSDNISDDIKKFILKNKSKSIINAIEKRKISNLKICYLRQSDNIPKKLVNLIIDVRKDDLLKDLAEKPSDVIVMEILFGNYCQSYLEFMIEHAVSMDILKDLLLKGDDKLIALIVKTKTQLIENIINEMSLDELLSLSYFDKDFVKELITSNYQTLILNRLKSLPKDIIYTSISDYTTSRFITVLLLKIVNISEKDSFNALELIKYNDPKKVIENFSVIKEFIEKSGISFDSFIEYGCGNENYNWFDKILFIIENGYQENFYKVVKYLMSELYFEDSCKENMVYSIVNFLEITDNFSECYQLLMNLLKDNVLLDKEIRFNLRYLFNSNYSDKDKVNTLEDLKMVRINILKQEIEIINNSNLLDELKNLFDKVILNDARRTLDNIGGTETLVALKKANCGSESLGLFIDNLIKCANVIEMSKACSNVEVLRKILRYFVIDNPSKLTILQTTYMNFKKNIQKLFEFDAKLNLSKLTDAKALGLLNEDLSLKYGGEVYDYRGVNYCLYAHVLSEYETMDMLVNGLASGNKNFLSVSSISYLGQKYYFDKCNPTIAIDTIPTGSFICGSLSNMSTNFNITNNSSEVKDINRKQRGILETSAVTKRNSEILLYRENVKPCGLILPGGREPSKEELEYHQKYNLPFILTQDVMTTIEDAKRVFKLNNIDITYDSLPKEIEEILNTLSISLSVSNKTSIYTGRCVALITDAHSLYEPTLAVLEDIRKSGIKEIYSLGDNIGVGPNPHEVMELLDKYNVISIAGNSEYYNTFGIEPFTYFNKEKAENQAWTYDRLTTEDLNNLKLYKPSEDLSIGGKKVGLCHFANDIRWDYLGNNSTWAYQQNFRKGVTSKQFLFTNSSEYKQVLDKSILASKDEKKIKGMLDAQKNPLFGGLRVTDYDDIFQGHVHFHLNDYLRQTNIHTLRAVGMGYTRKDDGKACYYVLKERVDGGFDIEKRLVDFNRNLLFASIYASNIPYKESVLRFARTI